MASSATPMPTPDDPFPRPVPQTYSPLVWPESTRHQLSPRSTTLPVDLSVLTEQRCTRRDFDRALSDRQLGEFLWLTCRSRVQWPSDYGFAQERRVCPSAGALHPVHVLVARSGQTWQRYDPIEHALVEIPGFESNANSVRAAAERLLDINRGVVLGLLCEPGKTDAKYFNSASLVWRDAGVILGYMSFVAEALHLAFCPLGITGNPELTGLGGGGTQLFGAGLAVVGASADTPP